jgi:hypothetical protein
MTTITTIATKTIGFPGAAEGAAADCAGDVAILGSVGLRASTLGCRGAAKLAILWPVGIILEDADGACGAMCF